MAKYFVIDWKRYGGGEAYKNIVGHALRQRHYRNRGNIDERRRKKNIVLHDAEQTSWQEYVQECNALSRESGGRALRKGSKDFFAIVVDSSVVEGWNEEDYIKYLLEAEKWLRERFKGQKLLYSVIHRDEKKPHLHIAFSYFNTERNRWSQKWLKEQKLDRLPLLLREFEEEIGKKFGLQKGESLENRGRKAVSKAIKIKTEKRGFLWWKRTKHRITGINKKQMARIGRALVFSQEYQKHKPEIQHTARISELNKKIEKLSEESHTLRQELQETREKLISQEKEIQRLREENREYQSLVRLTGSPEKLQSIVHRAVTDKIRFAGKFSSDLDSPKK